MINTMKTGAVGPQDQKGEVLRKITEQYGPPEEQRKEPVKKLGKDEFFKLMVTQLQHQDPMKPTDHEQMAAQLAQFSALEQMVNVNQNLEKLAQSQVPMQQMGAASLIGKYVTADGSRIIHTEGQKSEIKFELPKDAAKTRISILNEKGETVKEIDGGEKSKGEINISWNGKNERNMNVPNGNYMVQVFAEAENGQTIPIRMQKTEVVSGVSFQGKETVLLVGDPKNPHKMLLKNVSKIVDTNQKPQAGAAATGAGGMQIGNGDEENPFAELLRAQGIDPSSIKMPGDVNTEEGAVPLTEAMAGAQVAGAKAQNPYELEEPFTEFTPGAGQAAKYSPIDMSGSKPPVRKPVSTEDINPAAMEMSGVSKSSNGGSDMSSPMTSSVSSAAGKNTQSSQDGSAAGNLIE